MACQVLQRDGLDQADISIVGFHNGSPSSIEARWNGGAWTEIDAAPAGNRFSGTLTNQSVGCGVLEVRYANDTSKSTALADVAIGEVFVIAGQSNASGRGDNNQAYSHAMVKAFMFGNDYVWRELVDPLDDNTDQVDTVSSDDAGGSCWPLVSTEFLADQGVPVCFIPCAKGGTSAADWEPEADHEARTSLYGSMVYRAKYGTCCGVKAVLWQQGESDAISGTTQAAYNASLDTIANAINADLGCKLMACKIHDFSTGDDAAVNAAIAEAQGDNANVLVGPDFSAFTPDGDLHFTTDADLQKQAGSGADVGWWDAMKAAWY